MAVKAPFALLLPLLLLVGCISSQQIPVAKVVLLAPFEGRYREIGYNALYSARMALTDQPADTVELLLLDDGGDVRIATQRMVALQQDPTVAGILLMGAVATSAAIQAELPPVSTIIIGYWGASPQQENVFALTHPAIAEQTDSLDSSLAETKLINNETFAHDLFSLTQIPAIVENFTELTIRSSGNLPDEDFRARYQASGLFTPEPGLLATLTYDAVGLMVQSITTNVPLETIRYIGLNGTIQFADQFWQDAPIHTFRFQPDGTLYRVDS